MFSNFAEQCLQSTNDQSLPRFQDYGDKEQQIPRFHQAIIPSYKFQCCGNVTEWRMDLSPAGSDDNEQYTLNLQVWRPSPTVANTYNLVGNNRFPALSLSDGGAVVQVITPSPGNYIPFRSGDVLGVHIESVLADNGGLVILKTSTYARETVWLASVASQIGNRPVSVGKKRGQLNTRLRGAPVIEIDTSKSDILCYGIASNTMHLGMFFYNIQ